MGAFVSNPLLIETANNYSYDEEGRLIKDTQEGIERITWRVDGKVKSIERPSDSGKKNVSFDYNAFGNRIAKHVFDDDWNLEKSTYYILDAQGNQLSMYEHTVDSNQVNFTLAERNIYGSSRLGRTNLAVNMYSSTPEAPISEVLGYKNYELSNHLGNVLTVINDIKIPLSDDNETVSEYQAGIVSISDYSPFGVQLDGRTVSASSYRYGFQGQEKDDEVKGEGNSVNYKYRMHDPRVGRFFAVDPLFRKFPYWSPFAFSGNQVIHTVELEGLENENNLNENEQEQEVQIHQMPDIYVKQGKEGDWIAGGRGTPLMFMIYSPDIQAENFAEIVRGEVKRERNEWGGNTPVVVICSNSFVAHDVFALLEEQHGIKEDQLTKAEKRELLTVRFDKDRSDLFNYRVDNVVELRVGAIAVPIAATTALPIVLYPGDMVSAGDVYIPAARLAQGLVDEFAASRAKTKQKERAAKKTSSADSKYKQEAEHTKNARPSSQPKHQKGQTRKITDKGGEKGDKKRTRYYNTPQK
jgi:RHS repeat-associated protein